MRSFRPNQYLPQSRPQLPDSQRSPNQFPPTQIDSYHAGQRLRRKGIGEGDGTERLRARDPAKIQLFQLWRLHATALASPSDAILYELVFLPDALPSKKPWQKHRTHP